jgi:type IV secretion system protein VirD4
MNVPLIALAVGVTAGAAAYWSIRRHWGWRTSGLLSVVSVLGLAVAYSTGGPAMWAGVVAVLVTGLAVVWYRRGGNRSIVDRWGARARRTGGVATTFEIWRKGSAWARRRKATVVRPSLGQLSARDRRKLPASEYALRLLVTPRRQKVYGSREDVAVVIGGPRTGKTGYIGGEIRRAPGASLITSTRLDLHEATHTAREHLGPVMMFNPGGLGRPGRHGSDVGFDPLHGCDDPITPIERATDMIPTATGEGERWAEQARRVFAAHLHAAALGGRTLHDVQRWIATPEDPSTQREVRALLGDSPQPAFIPAVMQFQTLNNNTRSSITTSIMPALQWLASPDAERATQVGDGEPFDVARFVRERGTVYLLGRNESYTSPLLAAFSGAVIRQARRLASDMPGGRIDPTLSMWLDEAGRAARVPLDDWTGDAGGSGIQIVAAVQSLADLVDAWGKTGASKIANNAGAILLFGGTKDPEDLKFWTELFGTRQEVVKTYGPGGRVTSRTTRPVPVLAPSQLANLPEAHAVAYVRGMSPVIGRPVMFWQMAEHKAAMQRQRLEAVYDVAWGASWPARAHAEVIADAEQLVADSPIVVDTAGTAEVPAPRPSAIERTRS